MNESNDHNNDFDSNLSSLTKTKSKETNSENPTNFQGFPMRVMTCSYCYKESWHTRYIYKGWRSHCCNA
jgi:hypothetical protein